MILKVVQLNRIYIELSVREKQDCKLVFTARDTEQNILWERPMVDEYGTILTYPTFNDAVIDAKTRLKI